MASCSFQANGLTSVVSGQKPTFSYRQTSHSDDYFGVQMTFLSGSNTCYGGTPPGTPYITNSAFSRNCIWNYVGYQSYTALLCTASVTDIPTGVLTVAYKGVPANAYQPIPFLATFGPAPAAVVVTSTTTSTLNTAASTTLSPQPSTTVTVTASGVPITRTNTMVITQPTTSTSTAYVSSCSPTPTPSPSPSSSRSPSPSTSSSPSPSPSSSLVSSSSSSSSSRTPSSGLSPSPTPSSSSSPSNSSPSRSPSPSPSSASQSLSSSSSQGSSRASSSIVSSSSTVPAPSATAVCPGDDGKTFSTSKGDFVIECFYDRIGNDLGQPSPPASSFEGCMQACAALSNCQAVSYAPNGPCYLKSDVGTGPKVNTGIWGARLKSAASISILPPAVTPSSTSTAPQPTSTVLCPGSDGQIIQTSAGPFQIECGIDRSDNDMLNISPVYPGTYELCLNACAAAPGCVQVSYNPGGACYLKKGVGYPNKAGNVIGGRLLANGQVASSIVSKISTPAVPTPTYATITMTTTIAGVPFACACAPTDAPRLGGNALICPFADGVTYTSDCGAKYKIECSSDRYGNDLPGILPYVSSLGECIKACDNTPGCVDLSYSPGTPGPCYLKGTVGAIRVNSNIWGALQISQCTSKSKLKLHRKRVAHGEPKKHLQKRAIPYGPDYTYITTSSTTTRTSTNTVFTATNTVTPAKSGATTTTVSTTATVTTTVTSTQASTVSTTVTMTTCPARVF